MFSMWGSILSGTLRAMWRTSSIVPLSLLVPCVVIGLSDVLLLGMATEASDRGNLLEENDSSGSSTKEVRGKVWVDTLFC